MFVDINHRPGRAGFEAVFEPMPLHLTNVTFLGTYRAAQEA